jgi:glyoxylase-like metal-dependent hydrolase (beta-lactamase superfamily II)
MAGLNIDIFNTGYRPVPSAIPVWPDGQQATWPATTSTLISGEHDGVVVDALVTTGASQELADWLVTTGKNLTEVYITHAHGDHFFGLNTVLDKFPKARAVALPELVPLLAEQATPEWMQIWNSFFPRADRVISRTAGALHVPTCRTRPRNLGPGAPGKVA